MASLVARMRELEQRLSRPIPGLHIHPGSGQPAPRFNLALLSTATKMQLLQEVRQLRPDNQPIGVPFTFDLSLLSDGIKVKMLVELQARTEQQEAS
jgi:hypothetical protein